MGIWFLVRSSSCTQRYATTSETAALLREVARAASSGADTGIKMVEVSVSDNGTGIPAGEFDKIFNRFQQVSTTLSDRPQGTGLGLTISKEIVEYLGGDIWAKSEPGKGSTFFFTIPVEQSPVQAGRRIGRTG